MKVVCYRCKACGETFDEFYNDTEKPTKSLKKKCECGGKIVRQKYYRVESNGDMAGLKIFEPDGTMLSTGIIEASIIFGKFDVPPVLNFTHEIIIQGGAYRESITTGGVKVDVLVPDTTEVEK